MKRTTDISHVCQFMTFWKSYPQFCRNLSWRKINLVFLFLNTILHLWKFIALNGKIMQLNENQLLTCSFKLCKFNVKCTATFRFICIKSISPLIIWTIGDLIRAFQHNYRQWLVRRCGFSVFGYFMSQFQIL